MDIVDVFIVEVNVFVDSQYGLVVVVASGDVNTNSELIDVVIVVAVIRID